MTKQEIEYKLTEHTYRFLKGRGYPLICAAQHCGEPLKIGDTIIRKALGTRNHRSKRYHKKCWESLLIEC